MKKALPKLAVFALVIVSLALVSASAFAGWLEYLPDPNYPNIFHEYQVTATQNTDSNNTTTPLYSTTLYYAYDGNSYWRQSGNTEYKITTNESVANNVGGNPLTLPTNTVQTEGYNFTITLPTDQNAGLILTQLNSPPALNVAGFVIPPPTPTNTNSGGSNVVSSGSPGTNTSVVLPGNSTSTGTGGIDPTTGLPTTGGIDPTTGLPTTTTGSVVVVPSYPK